ncbi:MAG: hypothetical protein AB7P17_15640, partial [Nitrospirales bacterium]
QVFDEEHAKWYFGRNGEIQRVLEKLKISRFLAIVGPSGSGKSSLARAGLIPRLREGALPGSDTWPMSVLCPGSNPLASLAALLLRIHPAEGMPQTVDSLSNDPRTLHLAASLLLSQKPSTARMFLLIDQFEEIFTLCSSEEERTSFLENLVYAGSQPGGKLTVVLTMRADFYPKCAAYPDFSTRLASHQFLVSPMSEDGLRQAIEAPAHLLNHEFEEGLVDTILKDISAQPGALPLLEYALMELWDRRRGRLLTLEGYREIGGIEGALAQRADSIFQQFSPIEQGFVRQLMLRLTQPGEGTEDTRRRTEIGQLSLSHSKGSMDHVVHAMVNSRLLTVSRDETTNQENLIEVSHEALIRGWPKLRQWIDADREGIREHHRINEAAQEWKGMKGQDDGYLFRGLRLAQALEWSTLHDDQLNEDERSFLRVSLEKQAREEQALKRRRQTTVGGLLIAILLISAAAMMAYWERGKAEAQGQVALSRELAAQADKQFDSDPERSLLLAREGLEIAPTIEARRALIRAINFSPMRNYLKGHTDSIWASAFHPDNTTVVTASDDGTARLFDVLTGSTIKVLPHRGAVNVVKFSPNGQWIMTGSNDSEAKVWGGRSGEFYAVFNGHHASILEGTFSPNSQLLATASRDHTVMIWEVNSKKLIQHFQKHQSEVTFVAFSPDGRLVASASKRGEIIVWDPYTGKIHHTFKGHEKEVWMLEFHPTDPILVSASWDHTARVWAMDKARPPEVLDHGDRVHIAHFSPNGDAIVTAGTDSIALVWSTKTGQVMSFLKGHSKTLYTAEFSSDGRWIVTASFDGTAKIWDWQHGPLGLCVETLRGHRGHVYSAIFSKDGQWILTAGKDGIGRIWQSADRWYKHILRSETGISTKAVFRQQAHQIIASHSDGMIKVLSPESGSSVSQFYGHTQPIIDMVLDEPGEMVFMASRDGTISQWHIATEKLVQRFTAPDGEILSLAYHTSTELVMIGQMNKTARVWKWNMPQAQVILSGHSNWVTDVAIHPEGNLVATVSLDRTVRLWNPTTGTNEKTIPGHEDGINSVAFSPRGTHLLTASADQTVRLWNVPQGDLVQEFWGHSAPVHSAEFHPSGSLIVTAGEDGSVRIWEVESGRSLLEFVIPGDTIKGASFHPTKNEVLAFSSDGTIRVLAFYIPDSLDELLQHSKEQLKREFTPREKRAFFASPDL